MDQSIRDGKDPQFSATSSSVSDHWRKPIALPEEMENFALCDFIGQGSSGQVYRAVQTKEFAIKIIPWRQEDTRQIAKREYEISQLFSSCNEVVHSFGCYERDHQSYILMEYGIPCLPYYSGRKTSIQDILNVILSVCSALEEIHAHGYTHFDVKPENILIVRGNAKLGDFSHCSSYSAGQTYDRTIGTGAYTAPEIMPGGKHTEREDIYSLGITMYSLLTAGRTPFDFSKRETQRREREDRIESLFIHPELMDMIKKAAAYDADDRYASFHELSEDIHSFMEAHEGEMGEEVPTYRMIRFFEQTIPPFSAYTASEKNTGDGFETKNQSFNANNPFSESEKYT